MIENISKCKTFGGVHAQYSHYSEKLKCDMRFAIYLPECVEQGHKVPVLYWLSGLTCTDENFMQKAGALRVAAKLGIAVVAPDTSPRGENVPDDLDKAYDFGLGAGFYLNATQDPWQKNYQMYDYVVEELPNLIEAEFPVTDQRFLSGHSMGGHGALTIALKNSDRYLSVTAFSPIVNPMDCPWGKKAFRHYLGDDQTTWQDYDSCYLMEHAKTHIPMLVDQGSGDAFLQEQLKTQKLIDVAEKSNYDATIRLQEGYDHSYYFIATFIEEHMEFHMSHLK